jgi:hypothetical protein
MPGAPYACGQVGFGMAEVAAWGPMLRSTGEGWTSSPTPPASGSTAGSDRKEHRS